MSPTQGGYINLEQGGPRASGDEPIIVSRSVGAVEVVPARAGMSPPHPPAPPHGAGGPRASGDEPQETQKVTFSVAWSPRERG